VKILDPKKGEKILDPACGTAGFLISSYKHILASNRDEKGESTLTPDEKGLLARDFTGYDISPDMVRLSLVNMYLHGFVDPHIYEYDTLTSQERWNEYADVILANPPFMSPKGGIRPHNRFSVQSKRSEVLFVDYMAEHLSPKGRAAIIVPEGIIFQSQSAYVQLRKRRVDDYLVAVVSLPAGVFNPYSGVKTSILILDKELAKRSSTIGFFKVENDGFGLGAQRRSIDKNDLPLAISEIAEYLRRLKAMEPVDDFAITLGLIVPKEKISATGDLNLSGERYQEQGDRNHSFPLIPLGNKSIFQIESGGTPKSDVDDYWNGGIPWATLVDLPATDFISQIRSTQRTISEKGLRESSAKIIPINSVIVSTRATIGRIGINRVPIATNQGFKNIVIKDQARVVPEYVALSITRLVPTMKVWATGGTFAEISKSKFCELEIPLPSLEVQKEIVAEIEGYQKVIDGARAVIDNYRPSITIDPNWPVIELGELYNTKSGTTPSRSKPLYFTNGTIPWVKTLDLNDGSIITTDEKITTLALNETHLSILPVGTVLVAMYGGFNQIGRTGVLEIEATHNQAMTALLPNPKVNPYFLNTILIASKEYWKKIANSTRKDPNITKSDVLKFKLPVPSLNIQGAIVAEIETEQKLVDANRELIARFEKKIQAVLARLWGESDEQKEVQK